MSEPHRKPKYSVIVPVYNEESVLEKTVPSVLAAIGADEADVVYVCNGTVDNSADCIRRLAGDRVRIIEIAEASKANAFNVAEATLRTFPRFYVDADVLLPPKAFSTLVDVLQSDQAELVCPKIHFETATSSWIARKISQTWLALPHAKHAAFHHVLGLSASGRQRWKQFPFILADDAFIEAMIPLEKRKIIDSVTLTTWPPQTFWGWVGVRARWTKGQKQLAALGIITPRVTDQKAALKKLFLDPHMCLGACFYSASVFLSAGLLKLKSNFLSGWFQSRPQKNSNI
jgi:glycosyltransferase involved in cell wall biosynthesis